MIRNIIDILKLAWRSDGYPGRWRYFTNPLWMYRLFKSQWDSHTFVRMELAVSNEELWPESGNEELWPE